MSEIDKYMKLALKEAEKAYKIDEVPVGAIIVKDGKVIARGYNKREKTNITTKHAEIIAIEKACKKLKSWRLDGCEMYVTLEPCLMCAGAIFQSRIKKVYFGAFDNKAGGVVSKCKMFDLDVPHKVEYLGGLNAEENSQYIKKFFNELRKKK